MTHALIWRDNRADTEFGAYRIMYQVGTGNVVLLTPGATADGFKDDETEAMADAQADYDNRRRPDFDQGPTWERKPHETD